MRDCNLFKATIKTHRPTKTHQDAKKSWVVKRKPCRNPEVKVEHRLENMFRCWVMQICPPRRVCLLNTPERRRKIHPYAIRVFSSRVKRRFNMSVFLPERHVSEHSFTVLLKLPITVIQWTDLTCSQPSRNAMEMESMVTNTPCNCAFFAGRGCLVRLTFNTCHGVSRVGG